MIKRKLIIISALLLGSLSLGAQEKVSLDINSRELSGKIDPLLYGQLFEHIYFSANNGVWQ